MSITALLWAALYCGAILFAFLLNPVFGALGYVLEYYMRPDLKWWGDELPNLRYNLIVSMVLAGAYAFHYRSLREMKEVINPILPWLLGLGGIMLFVTFTFSISETASINWTIQWFKMALIFPLLLVAVVRTPGQFNLFIAAHMLGAFWWGWNAWQDPRRQAGRLIGIGSGDSWNDNGAAAHLVTVLPFALILLLTEKQDKRVRLAALISAPFVINTLILCNSRGSIVALVAAAGAGFFLVRTGYRLRMVGAAIVFAAAFLALADDPFINRQQTTSEYQQDSSAQQRLVTWQAGVQLVIDRPFGNGGRGFHLLSPQYIPEIVAAHGGDLRAPHNTFVMVATEWGVLGFIAFIGAQLAAIRLLGLVKKRDSGHGFYYWRALALQLALIAHLGAGAFTDRLYGEAGYWMLGLAFALYRIQCTEAETVVEAPPRPVLSVRERLRLRPSYASTQTR